jgi:threonine dehydrogenase-like Zn-dependent dehydrogenase
MDFIACRSYSNRSIIDRILTEKKMARGIEEMKRKKEKIIKYTIASNKGVSSGLA